MPRQLCAPARRHRRLITLIGFAAGVLVAPLSMTSGQEWAPRRQRSTPRPPSAATAPSEGPLALLVQTADTSRGQAPYSLVDQFGRVQRYVEPSHGIDLAPYVGQQVRVKHDTGRTLLASQLTLPARTADAPPARFAAPDDVRPLRVASRVVPAAAVEDAGNSAPIVLEDLRNGAAESLPAPGRSVRQRLEPIPSSGEIDHGRVPFEVVEGEPVHDGVYYDQGPQLVPGDDGGGYSTGGSCGCDSCRVGRPGGGQICDRCVTNGGWCGPTCNPPSRRGFYGRAEYLLWWFDGMDTPPLVTTNDQGGLPDFITPGTRILYGGGDLLDDPRSGMRFTVGAWLDNQRDVAVEADLFYTETETDGFTIGDPTGRLILGRPFYDLSPVDSQTGAILPPEDSAELVSFPDQIGGTVAVRARSEFESIGLRLRTGLCCREIGCGGCSSCDGCSASVGGHRGRRGIARVDFVGGYRYADFEEGLSIEERLTALPGSGQTGEFAIFDRFDTDNTFHGVDLGFVYDWEVERWALELTSRIALGNTRQRVRVNGGTTVTADGDTTSATGGLLALDSNMGEYNRSRFGVLPELSARLAYRVTPRLRLTAAYSLVYWANVVRPGDQIDLDIDPRFLPTASISPLASSHPQFAFHETSLWMHGFNFGVDYAY
ncbi:MAG: BBP7 family outer membrane beta-barrel protein [Lacipirellulaceae bacterium]